jgi:hypothetical protein
MKYFFLSLLGVLATVLAPLTPAQDVKNPLEGIVCLDVVEKLDSNSLTGSKVLIWQCCGGIKLFAKLRVQGSGKTRRTVASNWRAEDANGTRLATVPQNRTRTVSLKGNLNEKVTEQLLVIKSQSLCFVIAQKREIVR